MLLGITRRENRGINQLAWFWLTSLCPAGRRINISIGGGNESGFWVKIRYIREWLGLARVERVREGHWAHAGSRRHGFPVSVTKRFTSREKRRNITSRTMKELAPISAGSGKAALAGCHWARKRLRYKRTPAILVPGQFTIRGAAFRWAWAHHGVGGC